MDRPGYALIADLWLSHNQSGYEQREVVNLTHLKPSYVSKYLSTWKRNGILRHEGYGKRYFLADEPKLYQLVFRAVDSTGASLGTSPPPLKTDPNPHYQQMSGLLFPKSLIDSYAELAAQPGNARYFIKTTGDRDPARRIIINAGSVAAMVARGRKGTANGTYNGTVYLTDSTKDWQSDISAWFPDSKYTRNTPEGKEEEYTVSVLEQMKTRKWTGQFEIELTGLTRRMLKASGIKIGFEHIGSQTGSPSAETHGLSTDQTERMIYQAQIEQLAETGAIVVLQDKVNALEEALIQHTVTSNMMQTVNNQKIDAILKAVTVLTDGMSALVKGTAPKSPEQPYAPPATPQPPRGMFQ